MRALVHGHTCDHQRLGSADHLVDLEEQRRGNGQPSSFAVLRWMTNSHVVGCSTGGPPALDALLSPLPPDFPWPILVAQHMPATFTGPLARRLDRLCALDVVEVTGPMPIARGKVYVAKGDADMIVASRSGSVVVTAVMPPVAVSVSVSVPEPPSIDVSVP